MNKEYNKKFINQVLVKLRRKSSYGNDDYNDVYNIIMTMTVSGKLNWSYKQ